MNRFRFALLALVSSSFVLSLTGCVALLPFTEPDGGGGSPAQRGEYELSAGTRTQELAVVGATSIPGTYSQNGSPQTAKSRALSRAEAKRLKTMNALVYRLQHGTPAQRTGAATELARYNLDQPSPVPHLAYALKHDESKWVRRAAAKSLGKIGSQAAIEPLTGALHDTDRWVAHTAANALSRIRGTRTS